jgi:hypothetical protein
MSCLLWAVKLMLSPVLYINLLFWWELGKCYLFESKVSLHHDVALSVAWLKYVVGFIFVLPSYVFCSKFRLRETEAQINPTVASISLTLCTSDLHVQRPELQSHDLKACPGSGRQQVRCPYEG